MFVFLILAEIMARAIKMDRMLSHVVVRLDGLGHFVNNIFHHVSIINASMEVYVTNHNPHLHNAIVRYASLVVYVKQQLIYVRFKEILV
jgi:F0F1-type ATP synthase delta subunit